MHAEMQERKADYQAEKMKAMKNKEKEADTTVEEQLRT